MLIYINSLYYVCVYPNRGKNRRGRPRVLSKLHATKRPSKVNRRPGRKPGFSSNVHGSSTKTYHMGKMKQCTDAHVKDSEQKDFSGLTSSSTRVGIMVSRGEEVVRHICLMLMVFKIHDYLPYLSQCISHLRLR
jgi:hypothetical protein